MRVKVGNVAMGISRGNRWIGLLMLLIMCVLMASPVEAKMPYNSYTYNVYGEAVPTQAGYNVVNTIHGAMLPGGLRNPQDLFIDQHDNMYIADMDNGRIVVLGLDGHVQRTFGEGVLQGPKGIFVKPDGTVYVTDPRQQAIVVFDAQGKEKKIFTAPKSNLLTNYIPSKILVDARNYMYVVCEGELNGLVQLDPSGVFQGFFGRTVVPYSYWQQLIWRLTLPKEQVEAKARASSSPYSNLSLDSEGFIYGTVEANEFDMNQIKRLSPVGVDTLNFVNKYYGDYHRTQIADSSVRPNFQDIAVDKTQIFSALDAPTGRVFQYDSMGNLLFTFGGRYRGTQVGVLGVSSGTKQEGLFVNPVSLAEDSVGNVYVLDQDSTDITCFGVTAFGALVHQASEEYVQGRYDEAVALWKQVSQLDSTYDLAYFELGKAYFKAEDYEPAMVNYRLANNNWEYSVTFFRSRQQWLQTHFGEVAVGIIVVWFLVLVVGWFRRKRGGWLPLHFGEEPRTFIEAAVGVLRNPADAFWLVKYQKYGKTKWALGLVVAACVVRVVSQLSTSYSFSTYNPHTYNIGLELAWVVMPWVLWCVANWSLSTLFGGEGSFKDVVVASGLALLPYVIFTLPIALLSNILSSNEAQLYQLLQQGVILWTACLILRSVCVTHSYSMGQGLVLSTGAVMGMGLILLLGFLLFGLVTQIGDFGGAIYREIMIRS